MSSSNHDKWTFRPVYKHQGEKLAMSSSNHDK